MSVCVACIAGEQIHRQWQAGHWAGEKIPPHQTPFGPSNEIYVIRAKDVEYYLLPRYGSGLSKVAPSRINYRANMYALKDLGVDGNLSFFS